MLVLDDGCATDRPLVRLFCVRVCITSNRYPVRVVYVYTVRLTLLSFVYGVSLGGMEWRFWFIHKTNQVLSMNFLSIDLISHSILIIANRQSFKS